jgi:hypothetical protein
VRAYSWRVRCPGPGRRPWRAARRRRGRESGGQAAGAQHESSLEVIEAPGAVVHVAHDEERRPRAEDLQRSHGRIGVEVGGNGHCHSLADLP